MLQRGPWCRTRAGVKQWVGKDTSMSSEAGYLEALCLLVSSWVVLDRKVLRDTVCKGFSWDILNIPLLIPLGDTNPVQC